MANHAKSYNDYLKKANKRLQILIDSPDCPAMLKIMHASTIRRNEYIIRRKFTRYNSDTGGSNTINF